MATATNYVINVLELPANQIAAALFNQSVIVSAAADIGTPREWSHSPMAASANGAGGMSSFTDIATTGAGSRTTTAQAALAVEQARIQARQDAVNRDIAIITATP
jgi:hypothetical protein